jgi:ketosteroid isomerase-like protein
MDNATGVHVTTERTDEPGTGWVVKANGKIDSSHRTKTAAIAAGRVLAKRHGEQFTVHRRNGSVVETRTYAKSPL